MLDIFAIIILLTLLAFVIGVVVILGLMPGRIARQRNHPQADAINVCAWVGVITLGLLLPVAYVWAFTNADYTLAGQKKPRPDEPTK